jgi:uncharacterized FAD-dependent dehydrogenase
VEPSYKPGVHFTDLAQPAGAACRVTRWTPSARRCRPSERQIKGFDMADAVLTGVETRTSSPLRITRGRDCQSLNVKRPVPGR